jgi:hypothetical protein
MGAIRREALLWEHRGRNGTEVWMSIAPPWSYHLVEKCRRPLPIFTP